MTACRRRDARSHAVCSGGMPSAKILIPPTRSREPAGASTSKVSSPSRMWSTVTTPSSPNRSRADTRRPSCALAGHVLVRAQRLGAEHPAAAGPERRVGDRRGPELVQLGRRRGDRGAPLLAGELGDVGEHEPHRGELGQDALGLAVLVPRDVPAGRRRRRGGHPGDLHRLRVDPDRVQGEVREDDRMVGRRRVEIRAAQTPARIGDALGEEPEVPPVAADPGPRRLRRRGTADQLGDVGDRRDLARRDVQRERRAARAPLPEVRCGRRSCPAAASRPGARAPRSGFPRRRGSRPRCRRRRSGCRGSPRPAHRGRLVDARAHDDEISVLTHRPHPLAARADVGGDVAQVDLHRTRADRLGTQLVRACRSGPSTASRRGAGTMRASARAPAANAWSSSSVSASRWHHRRPRHSHTGWST